MLLLLSVILAAARICLAVEVNDSMLATDRLHILRCCRPGEDLENAEVKDSEIQCLPSSELFRPLIYSPDDQAFLDEPPSNWLFEEHTRPQCLEPQELRFVLHNDNNPFVLFADGQVLIEAGGDFLGPDEYCLGSRSLLACLSRRNDSLLAAAMTRPKIRKCCGEKATYNSERYVIFKMNNMYFHKIYLL